MSSERDLDKLTDELMAAAKSEQPTEAVKLKVLTEVLGEGAGGGARPLSRWMWWIGGLSVLVLGLFAWATRETGASGRATPDESHVRALTPADTTRVEVEPPQPAAEPRPDALPAVEPQIVVVAPVPVLEKEPAQRMRAPPTGPPPEAEDELAKELALLDVARRDVSSAPGKALATLQEHARRFPKGALSTEADLLRVEALVRAGRRAEATTLGRRLTAKDATGPLAERVQRLLEGTAP